MRFEETTIIGFPDCKKAFKQQFLANWAKHSSLESALTKLFSDIDKKNAFSSFNRTGNNFRVRKNVNFG